MKESPKLISILSPILMILILLGSVGNLKADVEVDDVSNIKDIIALYPFDTDECDDMRYFHGKITKVKDCFVHFKSNDGEKFRLPGNAIGGYYIQDATNVELDAAMLNVILDPNYACTQGTMDAQQYHKKALGNYAGGLLLGVFWVIGAAVAKPTPYKSSTTLAKSQNEDLFTDAMYLECYKKKARGTHVLAALGGWATWIAIVVLASAAGES